MMNSLAIILAVITFSGTVTTGDPPLKRILPHHPHDVISAVAFSPGYPEDGRIFVASPGTINLFLTSSDHGLTWKPSRSGIRGEVFREIALASDWAESGVMYVVTEDGGLQTSSNAGKTWEPPTCSKRLRFLVVPPVDSKGRRTLFFAAVRAMFASFDGGATFKEVLRPAESHIESIAVSPQFEQDSTLFVGTSDGNLMISKSCSRRKALSRVATVSQSE